MSSSAAALLPDPHVLQPGRTGRTQWSRVRRLAQDGRSAEDASALRGWEDAWFYLWETFRPAMLATVRRTLARAGAGVVPVEEAEDVVQSFLVTCLEEGHLTRADPELGRFRTFVAVCLRRHTLRYVERRRRLKRCPRTPPLPLTAAAAQVAAPAPRGPSARTFEEEWARCLLEAALPRVRARSAPNADLLEALYEQPDLDHDALALRFGMTKAQVAVRLHRARRMFAEEVWTVAKQTVANAEDLEDEKVLLSRALARYLDARTAPSLFT